VYKKRSIEWNKKLAHRILWAAWEWSWDQE
jgi:hypothetical protein